MRGQGATSVPARAPYGGELALEKHRNGNYLYFNVVYDAVIKLLTGLFTKSAEMDHAWCKDQLNSGECL
jgi:hypothetical protein